MKTKTTYPEMMEMITKRVKHQLRFRLRGVLDTDFVDNYNEIVEAASSLGMSWETAMDIQKRMMAEMPEKEIWK